MIYHRVYKCPKCFNTLLVSNKMLHDLRCTEENPATYENILFRQSQQIPNNSSYNNYNDSGFSERMSIKNDDGTMIDIRKEKNLRGKDEYVEIKYDPQGNVISRKKASNHGYGGNENNFNDISEFDDYEDDDFSTNYDNSNNTYYEINKETEIRKAPSIIYETAEPQEIIYEAPAKYDPNVTINKPIFETTINSDTGISDTIMDDIIRNTLTRNNDNNNFGNHLNIHNNSNINEYDYSQNYTQNYSKNKNQNSNSYNQEYNMNNYDNQFNYENNGIYKESTKESGNKTADMNNFNYNSYDYQY